MGTESVVSNVKECYFCHQTIGLHRHHVFFGNPNRAISEREGCWVWLCAECHTGRDYAVHRSRSTDLVLKHICQTKWMELNNKTIDDFRAVFGKSYI